MKSCPSSSRPPRVLPRPLPCRLSESLRRQMQTTLRKQTCTVMHPSRCPNYIQNLAIEDHILNPEPRSPAPSRASAEEAHSISPESVQAKTEPTGSCLSPGPTSTGAKDQEEEEEVPEEDEEHTVLLANRQPSEVDPEFEDVDQFREIITPVLSDLEDSLSNFSRPSSSLFSRSTLLNSGLSSVQSGIGDLEPEDSIPLSQLRSSYFSLSALTSPDPEATSRRTSLHSLLPPGPSCHDNRTLKFTLSQPDCHSDAAQPQQTQTYSVGRQSQSEMTPSFVEIWHDRALHQWPVLPPISPQRDGPEERHRSSQISYVQPDVFDEAIFPRKGSSLSQEYPESIREGCSSVDTELSRRTASLSLGCMSEAGSLSHVRLLLLDHNCEDPLLDPSPLQMYDSDRDSWRETTDCRNGVIGAHERITSTGFPYRHAPAFFKENRLPDTCTNKGIDDRQSIYTMLHSEVDCSAIGSSSPLKDHSWSTSPQSDSVSAEEGNSISSSTGFSESEFEATYGEREFFKPTQKILDGGPTSTDRKGKEEVCSGPGCPGKGERAGEAGRGGRGRRRRPLRLEQRLREERERERRAEDRQAKVFHIYTKLREDKATAARPAETMSLSNFEDFDFLAKYCIFSQEKLALYKRAFEAADSDGDGYLTCFQVLVALKEIVPPEALTDAEEMYVYRILEMVDYHITDGLTDLKLFAVMASLAQKIAALDDFMRSLIGKMDFKALELKLYKARQLFLCNIDSQANTISAEQLLVELKAGGIREEHEEAVRRELRHMQSLDLLDFLMYLPLFVLIHNSVISNPLDDSKTL
ncbi:uncharacterized protein LOC136750424 [Amia ocellicauda]|uniref:uncharacterized protein LOC136750424 n=1 Tax=Amia ocellicauda TaxID=2972642 RepID=UPI0034648A6F